MAKRFLTAFEEIDWDTLDINSVFAFYEACSRPLEQRALLLAPINLHLREDWRRRCVADFKAHVQGVPREYDGVALPGAAPLFSLVSKQHGGLQ